MRLPLPASNDTNVDLGVIGTIVLATVATPTVVACRIIGTASAARHLIKQVIVLHSVVRAIVRSTSPTAATTVIARRIISTTAPTGHMVEKVVVFEGMVRAIIATSAATRMTGAVVFSATAAGNLSIFGFLGR